MEQDKQENKQQPVKFTYDAVGYENAVNWLKEQEDWDYVSTHGQSTDGWSIIQTANVLFEQRNRESF